MNSRVARVLGREREKGRGVERPSLEYIRHRSKENGHCHRIPISHTQSMHKPLSNLDRHIDGERARLVRERERERERGTSSQGGLALGRASVVCGGEAKKGSTPPHKGVTCEGARERETNEE